MNPFRWLAVALCCLAMPAQAVPIQWAPASGGNGNFYDVIQFDAPILWTEARDLAASMTHSGAAGHLATVTTSAENEFLKARFPLAVGLPNSNDLLEEIGAWIGGFQPTQSQPDPAVGWQWVTGEAFDFTAWSAPLEPNDFLTPVEDNEENFLHYLRRGWNDSQNDTSFSPDAGSTPLQINDFIVEFEFQEVPEPNTLAIFAMAIFMLSFRVCSHRQRS